MYTDMMMMMRCAMHRLLKKLDHVKSIKCQDIWFRYDEHFTDFTASFESHVNIDKTKFQKKKECVQWIECCSSLMLYFMSGFVCQKKKI